MPSTRPWILAASAVLFALALLVTASAMRNPPVDEPTPARVSEADSARAAEGPAAIARPPSSEASATWIGLMAFALALSGLGIAALATSLWFLLRWRGELQARGELPLLPEHVLHELHAQRKNLKRFVDSVGATQSLVGRRSDELATGFADLMEAFTTLQGALDRKDAEIERLRRGHDTAVFRRFLSRFLALEEAMGAELADLGDADSTARKLLGDMHLLLLDALEECGVEPFEPRIGESVRTAAGVADGYRTLPAVSEEHHLKIARIERRGMRIRTPTGAEVLREARVSVYVKGEAAPAPSAEERTA